MPYWLLVTIFTLLLLPGFAGVFLPLPSLPYMFGITLIFGFIDQWQHLSTWELIILGGIYLLWLTVGICSVIITVLSYLFLQNIDPNITGILESFAAGAILAMLADTMMPEAYSEGGFGVGIMTLLGFLAAFIISRM